MHTLLGVILAKETDYKICTACQCVNWYENDICHNCHNKEFLDDAIDVKHWALDELQFWVETMGYTEDGALDCEYSI